MKRFNLLVLRLILVGLLVQGANAISQEVSINKGIGWLLSNQNPSGSWGTETEYPNLCLRDTSLVADTLCYLGTTNIAYSKAIQWIE
ncbi:MAG: hypothetical protein AB1630_12500, partial [bacterium]